MAKPVIRSYRYESPLSDMNTTPLIDVMLVLLIMFIITIPIQTHAVKVALPSAPLIEPLPIKGINILIVSESGALLWNGGMVDAHRLPQLLKQTADHNAQLQFQPAARARYETVAAILLEIRKANIVRFSFVGNERYRTFASAAD